MGGNPVNIFWFRRDLRLEDNAGLYHALKNGIPVLPVFIFDKLILDKLENREDPRVDFIAQMLSNLQEQLIHLHSSLLTFHCTPAEAFETLLRNYSIQKVFCNHDYEPYALQRDEEMGRLLKNQSVEFVTYKDQVIFEKDEVVKDNGEPYTVFTPYSRKWKSKLNDFYLKTYPNEKYLKNFWHTSPFTLVTLDELGFRTGGFNFPGLCVDENLIRSYDKTRDYPGLRGTSRLGVHLRFGTISVRKLVSIARLLNASFLNELIWREFYQMILWHFPKIGKGMAFKAEYDNIEWRNHEPEFSRWCEGKTGYPLVDAGMRELTASGYMHNRVRMVTASFLTKHLLIDWRWGEAWFAEKLLDFDLAVNNGGWQWSAGCGCDAAPYFRIFNPELQAKKFDPDLAYVRRWVPEWDDLNYPSPMVDHDFARKRCLKAYGKALGKEFREANQ